MTVNPAAHPLAVPDAQRCQDMLRHIQCELLAPHGPIHATRRQGIVYWGEQIEQIDSLEIEQELRRSLPWHPALGDA